MVRTCTICSHPKRDEIEKAIAAGESYRSISHKYDVSYDAIKRHVKSGHIAKKIQKAKEAKDIKSGLTMLDKLQDLEVKADGAFDIAQKQKNPRGMCAAIQAKKGVIELAGKVTGEFVEKREHTGKDGGPIESSFTLNLTRADFRRKDDEPE